MHHIFKSFPIALRMIFKDPVNLILAILPTLMALALYFSAITYVFWNSTEILGIIKTYVTSGDQATLLAQILTVVLIILIFFFMSWTFVFVVGIIASPFNALLSYRIEKKLLSEVVEEDKKKALEKVRLGLWASLKNEAKKVILILIIGTLTFFLNIFPLFYPVSLFLMALLLAVQFLDYSWSRHEMRFGACLREVFAHLIPYGFSGFLFLLLITVPIINAFIPALATSYFTVLWLYRQNKIH